MSHLNPTSLRVVVRQNLTNNTAQSQTVCRTLYADRRMVVINKAPGMDAQVGVSQLVEENTEVTGISHNGSRDDVQKSCSDSLFPVHRLDKATTGCLVFARTRDMARELSRQFQQRNIEKTYYAIVRAGRKSFQGPNGVIDWPIEVSSEGFAKLQPSKDESVKVSRTEWELVGCSATLPLSLLRLRMLTGHKHQLRVHLSKFLHAPILGDLRHSVSRPTDNILGLLRSLGVSEDRLFLHSSSLGVMRYTKARKRLRLGVQAPFPDDFAQLLHHARISFDPELSRTKIFLDGEPLSTDTVQELDGRLFPSTFTD
ncbi:pseudouridine synthase [Marasmius fiardii PR-910]|nr:pseudouridine synthase [Marasmius fiardii PR-910]